MCDVLILVVTSYVTTCLSFFIYCLPCHPFYLDMCDVTTYVTPIMGSLSKFAVLEYTQGDDCSSSFFFRNGGGPPASASGRCMQPLY